MRPISILDLVRVRQGSDARTALDTSRDLAAHAEALGFTRFWVAEHHNAPGLASAATSLAVAHIAAGTSRIRVGAGGIMLPNHAPLVIAEQFGTLEILFPGRIDLGLGRAPGTDQATLKALRADPNGAEHFPQDILQLRAYFGPLQKGQRVQAVPATGTEVPLWILGSSLYGAQLAAHLGLPFAFAAHFSPQAMHQALRVYHEQFKPSKQLDRPYVIVSANIIAADTDREAQRLATTRQMFMVDMFRGVGAPCKPPIDDMDSYWTPAEGAQVKQILALSIVGSPATVKEGLKALVKETGADELMCVSDIFDHQARRHSLTLTAEALAAAKAD